MRRSSVESLHSRIVGCKKCPRLIEYCKGVAREKRRQFQDESYWGKPVPGFGDPDAGLLIVGLAPAAHGGNRTGRMFTGDNSGLWLYRALFRAGFSSHSQSVGRDDGLMLRGAYITAGIHCAPPANRPLPEELLACSDYLREEILLMTHARVYLVLGQIALKALWSVLPAAVKPRKALPGFGHGHEITLLDGRLILMSYHPSQQNTFTRKLTEPMFDAVFSRSREFLKT